MDMISLLADMLGGETAGLLLKYADRVTEVRLRVHRRTAITLCGGISLHGDFLEGAVLSTLLNRLMQNSLYACERELQQGYFTALGGCRVGVCGRINADRHGVESIAGIGSACIRIPREIRGCAALPAETMLENMPCGMLLLSSPGMGKTTMLRDIARILSNRGMNVAISDERREIAACVDGIAQLDIGANSDVLDGLPKRIAIPMLVRACCPQIIVADELGGREDALAVMDALRCGVSVIATAHASGLEEAYRREGTGMLLRSGAIRACVLLGDRPGKIKALKRIENEGMKYAEGDIAGFDSSGMHGGGQVAVQCAQTQI